DNGQRGGGAGGDRPQVGAHDAAGLGGRPLAGSHRDEARVARQGVGQRNALGVAGAAVGDADRVGQVVAGGRRVGRVRTGHCQVGLGLDGRGRRGGVVGGVGVPRGAGGQGGRRRVAEGGAAGGVRVDLHHQGEDGGGPAGEVAGRGADGAGA